VKSARAVVRSLQKKGLVETTEREAPADPFFAAELPGEPLPTLNRAQELAVAAIVRELGATSTSAVQERDRNRVAAFLLHGVTGSGKTEVYLRVIAEARARGLGALVLVPEIALTPQLVARFRARFGDSIAVLHSGLRPRERHQAWRSLREAKMSLAIGARSALFAPVQRLGVVVVDEEHDGSFKQEEGFRYHARDMALLRAHRAGAVAVLGSATPSLESYFRAEQGKLRLLSLPERATAHRLPRVEVVDLSRHRGGPSPQRLLSGPLHQALRECLEAKSQAILFLNRRGFAPSVVCDSCGEILECPACSVALTEHRRAGLLRCHYCDYSTPPMTTCPSCGATALQSLGLGTERLQDDLSAAFPGARVARLDRDTAAGEGVERVLERVRRGEIDILVGTQMVAKGHDIPGVTLVGVVLADQSLAFPDFRAAERTFQLLAQVAGRAGRGERPGRVVVQAYQTNHEAVRCAAEHDFVGFYRAELRARRELGYPPFARMVAVRIEAGSEEIARQAAGTLASLAQQHPLVRQRQVRVLGPAPAPIARLRARYRFRILLFSSNRSALHEIASALNARIDQGLAPARASLDVDPVSML
jgi:primosomal protein N' (replication factor Y)